MQFFSDLQNGDTFTLEADGSYKYRKDGDNARGYGGGFNNHKMQGETPVFNVETEAEANARYEAVKAQERAEKKAKVETHRVLAGAVAKILGWKLINADADQDTHDSHAELKGPDGMEIVMTTDGYRTRDKITIYGRSPQRGMRFTSTEINVSKEKTADKIAADITRRLLPEYTAQFTKARGEIAQADAYKNKVEENKKALQKVGVTFNNGNSSGHFEGGGVEVSGDSVSFKLYSVPTEKALKLVKLLSGA